jgi:hypothetical protein
MRYADSVELVVDLLQSLIDCNFTQSESSEIANIFGSCQFLFGQKLSEIRHLNSPIWLALLDISQNQTIKFRIIEQAMDAFGCLAKYVLMGSSDPLQDIPLSELSQRNATTEAGDGIYYTHMIRLV